MNRWLFSVVVLMIGAAPLFAAEDPSADRSTEPTEDSPEMLNAVMPTLGGKQFWVDELLFRDWRIQRNVLTNHYRLLDGKNLRRAWGSFDDCRARLEEIKGEKSLPPMSGKAVIVLHGLIRTRSSVGSMARYLADEGEYTTFRMSYASTRGEFDDHARCLAKVVDGLEGIEEINFVGHSLGNILIRRYLALAKDPESGVKADPRIKRIVMVGAPNHGARLAEILNGIALSKMVVGGRVNELGPGWSEFVSGLATPECEFGVIAGGRGDDKGYNPLLGGDDDMVVRVSETRLPGARDFIRLQAPHTFIMDNDAVQAATLRFLHHGYFVSEEERQPIGREESAPETAAAR